MTTKADPLLVYVETGTRGVFESETSTTTTTPSLVYVEAVIMDAAIAPCVVVKVGIFPEGPFGSVMVVTTLGGVVVGMYPLGAVLGGIGLWVLRMYADDSVL